MARNIGSVAGVAVAMALTAIPAAAATTETVLYSFVQQYGYPSGRLKLINGNLFGTDSATGGGYGQIFELVNSGGKWTEHQPLKFDGTDGANPYAGLIENSSVLFGTTSRGDVYGYGNVFGLYKHNGSWVHNTIWPFGGTLRDGREPLCDLIMDRSGALYGTTPSGGTDNLGTVFELTQSGGVWSETVLYNFTNFNDGAGPVAGLFRDRSGALYGTAGGGAYGNGVAFKLTRSGGKWSETVLHSFGEGSDGSLPNGILIPDSKGALYGTTYNGGASNAGTVFELYQSNGAWKEKVLYNFSGGSDGGEPGAGLTWNGTTLYSTTTFGGNLNGCIGLGCGTVFKLTQSGGKWSETVLYSFTDIPDGAEPVGAVILDKNGALYGTTSDGGAYGYGTVWAITP